MLVLSARVRKSGDQGNSFMDLQHGQRAQLPFTCCHGRYPWHLEHQRVAGAGADAGLRVVLDVDPYTVLHVDDTPLDRGTGLGLSGLVSERYREELAVGHRAQPPPMVWRQSHVYWSSVREEEAGGERGRG